MQKCQNGNIDAARPLATAKSLYYRPYMSTREQLIEEIERFLALSGISVTRFGVEAAGERGLLRRLKAGGDVTTETADRIRSYIKDWRPASPRHRADARSAA